ncbi:MAG TPA: glycosyltransferase [Chthoniobacterales bacterium]|nr:glycosyltransferase [Chthoniobacterales bacterium]
MKRILILTAGFGEGHNSAARGVRDGLARVAPVQVEVELRDLFPQSYGALNELVRKTYLAVINQWPHSWGYVYRWLDGIRNFDERFQRFRRLKKHFAQVLDRFQPDVLVSTFPPYPYLLRQIAGADRSCKNVVVITDSITVNAIWYQCDADFFLPSNEQSAAVVRAAGVAPEKIKVFGFPVNPQFADLEQDRQSRRQSARPHILCVIHAGKKRAPELVRKLLGLEIELTVAVGHDRRLHDAIRRVSDKGQIEMIGWTNEMPRLLCRSHILIGKAGGATVQETIAAGCPMIVSHVVSGQEEGNARLIAETDSGVIALETDEAVAQVSRAFADGAQQWREWAGNIAKLSRPRAALDIAQFLLSI